MKARLGPEQNGLPVAVLRTDALLGSLGSNHAWETLWSSSDARETSDWIELFAASVRLEVESELTEVLRTGVPRTIRVPGRVPEQWLELRIAPEGEEGDGLLIVALDISEEKLRESLLVFDAVHDSLTGLYNRPALLEHMSLALARTERHPSLVAALYIDLDGFKEINDTFGHQVGDRLLSSAARRLRSALRPSDVLGRVGGDEFVALCEMIRGPEEAGGVAERLVRSMEEPIGFDEDRQIKVGVSIGIAFAAGAETTPEELIDSADRAMYEAKRLDEPRIHLGSSPPRDRVSPGGVQGDAGTSRAFDRLARLESQVSRHWAEAVSVTDAEAADRWRLVAHHIGQAIAALGGDEAKKSSVAR